MDYVNIDEPVIMERLEDVEKITDDGRDLSYFQDRPGFGVTINEAMLRSNTIFKLEDVKNYQPDIIQHG